MNQIGNSHKDLSYKGRIHRAFRTANIDFVPRNTVLSSRICCVLSERGITLSPTSKLYYTICSWVPISKYRPVFENLNEMSELLVLFLPAIDN